MPKMHIKRSTDIAAPPSKIFSTLNDYHTWRAWSPWLISEPEAKVDVATDGKYYEWLGNRTGAGNMRIASESPDSDLDMDLTFLKPWKSKAKTSFHIEATDTGSRVSWEMNSSLPFFLFWMKKQTEAFIGSDYERGLAMLKDYVEDGEAHSKLEFAGIEDFPGTQYVGIRRSSSKENFQKDMSGDFGRLMDWFKESGIEPSGPGASIYHKWDMVRGTMEYTALFPVTSASATLPDGFMLGNIPAVKTYRLRHTGSYDHLGNAWSTLMMMERNKEFKKSKVADGFEVYRTMPGETPMHEQVTDLYYPVR
ncbi:MAG: SRPBCC family protein [Bacteroidota bacterium]